MMGRSLDTLWYASSNDKGKLFEGGANYAVRIKDSTASTNKLYALIRTYPGAAHAGVRAGSFVEMSPSAEGVQLRYHFNFANDLKIWRFDRQRRSRK